MFENILMPESASTIAPHVDALIWILTGMSAFFTFAVVAALAYLAIKYRKSSDANRDLAHPDNDALEITWTVIPTILAIVMFVASTVVFFQMRRPPEGATEIYVTGKQWMWKLQHPTGKREVNELHVPVGVPVKLTMTSEDVLHSFFIPAFRVKQDVLPNRYTQLWFEATKPGTYHLFCTEYCGTEHSRMIGTVTVLEQADYQRWLEADESFVANTNMSPGEALFTKHGCVTCHNETDAARGPLLAGKYGTEVTLSSGETVLFDEDYLRESIFNPQAKLVAGYAPLMPVFKNLISEDELFLLIDYIKSMDDPEASN
jgi:cytochrome c oxidase subunit II